MQVVKKENAGLGIQHVDYSLDGSPGADFVDDDACISHAQRCVCHGDQVKLGLPHFVPVRRLHLNGAYVEALFSVRLDRYFLNVLNGQYPFLGANRRNLCRCESGFSHSFQAKHRLGTAQAHHDVVIACKKWRHGIELEVHWISERLVPHDAKRSLQVPESGWGLLQVAPHGKPGKHHIDDRRVLVKLPRAHGGCHYVLEGMFKHFPVIAPKSVAKPVLRMLNVQRRVLAVNVNISDIVLVQRHILNRRAQPHRPRGGFAPHGNCLLLGDVHFLKRGLVYELLGKLPALVVENSAVVHHLADFLQALLYCNAQHLLELLGHFLDYSVLDGVDVRLAARHIVYFYLQPMPNLIIRLGRIHQGRILGHGKHEILHEKKRLQPQKHKERSAHVPCFFAKQV